MHNDPVAEAPAGSAEAAAWWTATLARLEAELPALAAEFVSHLAEEIPAYAQLDPVEVEATARRSLGELIRQLAGQGSAEQLRALASELGRRRAEQGIELERLLAAIRLDFRVLWAGLVRSVDETAAATLLTYAERVLLTVESYSSYAQQAFLAAREELAADRLVQVRRTLTHFLAAEDPGELVERVAELTGFSADGRFGVWVIRAGQDSDLLTRCEKELRRQRLVHQWTAVGESSVVVIEAPGPPQRPALREQDAGPEDGAAPEGTAAGTGCPVRGAEQALELGAVHSLAEVPDLVARARRLIEFAPAGRWSTEREVWVPFLHHLAADTLMRWRTEVKAGLETLEEAERARMLDTVLAFLSCGSTQLTAARCFVHRNTVLNRLRLFREVTGLDVTVPVDAAEALIALGEPVGAGSSDGG